MAPRAEVEKQINLIGRTCRGPKVFNDAQIAEHRAAFEAAKTLPELQKVQATLEKHHGLDALGTETMEEATSRISSLIYAYSESVGKPNPCGQNVNELIIAGKLDGKEHEVKCPKCGEILDYVPPVADEDSGSPAV